MCVLCWLHAVQIGLLRCCEWCGTTEKAVICREDCFCSSWYWCCYMHSYVCPSAFRSTSFLVMVTTAGVSTTPYASLSVKFAGAVRIFWGSMPLLSLTLERMQRYLPMTKQLIATAKQARKQEPATTPTIVIRET